VAGPFKTVIGIVKPKKGFRLGVGNDTIFVVLKYVILVKPEHPTNAAFSIDLTVLGIIKLPFKPLHKKNNDLLIVDIPPD
jgi:hypothetical protein